jgi:hypothetical protein
LPILAKASRSRFAGTPARRSFLPMCMSCLPPVATGGAVLENHFRRGCGRAKSGCEWGMRNAYRKILSRFRHLAARSGGEKGSRTFDSPWETFGSHIRRRTDAGQCMCADGRGARQSLACREHVGAKTLKLRALCGKNDGTPATPFPFRP